MRAFLITVDTEGDNLWNWHEGEPITTHNTKYIFRFQEMCEKYGFKPVYFTNYEMAMDDEWVKYGSEKARAGLCEIGMHIHAWNTPPEFLLDNKYGGNSYITEYPEKVIQEKVSYIVNLLQERFKVPIVSSRSGRWATDERYFKALVNAGIKIDCSVTPEIDLSKIPGCSKNCGNDYTDYQAYAYEIYPGLLEIPMTTRRIHWLSSGSIKHRIKTLVFGEEMWLRPHRKSQHYLEVISKNAERVSDYLEFMIHSSELMPAGSPYFRNEEEIEVFYQIVECFFKEMKKRGYEGYTPSSYKKLLEALKQ